MTGILLAAASAASGLLCDPVYYKAPSGGALALPSLEGCEVASGEIHCANSIEGRRQYCRAKDGTWYRIDDETKEPKASPGRSPFALTPR